MMTIRHDLILKHDLSSSSFFISISKFVVAMVRFAVDKDRFLKVVCREKYNGQNLVWGQYFKYLCYFTT